MFWGPKFQVLIQIPYVSTSINDDFNKTFRKSFLIIKKQSLSKKLMFGEVSCFFAGLELQNFNYFLLTLIIFTLMWHLTGMRIAHGSEYIRGFNFQKDMSWSHCKKETACFDGKGGRVVETCWEFSKVKKKFFDFCLSAKTSPPCSRVKPQNFRYFRI